MKKKILIFIPIILIIGILFCFWVINRNSEIPEYDRQTFNECKELILESNKQIEDYFSKEEESGNLKSVGFYENKEIQIFSQDKFLDILTKKIDNYSVPALQSELQNRGYKLLDNYVVNNTNFTDYKFVTSEHNEFEMVNETVLQEKYKTENLFLDSSIPNENKVLILVKGFINDNGDILLLYEIEKKLIGENEQYFINNVLVIGDDIRSIPINTININPNKVENYDNSHITIEE